MSNKVDLLGYSKMSEPESLQLEVDDDDDKVAELKSAVLSDKGPEGPVENGDIHMPNEDGIANGDVPTPEDEDVPAPEDGVCADGVSSPPASESAAQPATEDGVASSPTSESAAQPSAEVVNEESEPEKSAVESSDELIDGPVTKPPGDSDEDECDVVSPKKPKRSRGRPKESSGDASLKPPITTTTSRRGRECKQTNRLSMEALTPTSHKSKEYDPSQGKGTALGTMEYVEYKLSHSSLEDIKLLHHACFRRLGKKATVRREIRHYCGQNLVKDSDEYNAELNRLRHMGATKLRVIARMLGLDPKPGVDEYADELIEFLIQPVDTNKRIPKKSKSKSHKSKRKSTTTPKSKKSASTTRKTPKKSSAEAAEESDDSDDHAEEVTASSESASEVEEEDSDYESKKSKKRSIKRKSTAKSTGKAKRAKQTIESSESDASGPDDEDDAVVAAAMPSDAEVRKAVVDLLDGADLEEVTMKKVCQQVYDRYPGCDLSSKKDFIKAAVKEILSAS